MNFPEGRFAGRQTPEQKRHSVEKTLTLATAGKAFIIVCAAQPHRRPSLHPEVILDRFIRTTLCKERGCSAYLGKLDIDRVLSPPFRELLDLLHRAMNEALRLEGPNASGGVKHPPFHFDYVDVADDTENAHAFECQDVAFVVVTVPMVELVAHLSLQLVPVAADLAGMSFEVIDRDALWGLLSQILLNFVVAHEYTHHIHRHFGNLRSSSGIWTELLIDAQDSDLRAQAQELDADGYATLLVLTHLVRGERRASALRVLGKEPAMPVTEGDELLIRCFLLVVMAFLCRFWPTSLNINTITRCTHPLAPIRIQSLIQVTEMWGNENGSSARSWHTKEQLRRLFKAAAVASEREKRHEWDAQVALLSKTPFVEYCHQLFDAFDRLRRG